MLEACPGRRLARLRYRFARPDSERSHTRGSEQLMHPENDRFGDSVVADQDRFTSSRGDGWNASLISAYLSHKPPISTRASDKRTKLPRNATDRVTMDDDDLITAVTSGDDIALRTLFERHAPWLAARLRR